MKKIIINLKSYMKYNEIKEYKNEVEKIKMKDIDLTLLPSIPYLSMFKETNINIGAQNFYSYNEGSYTGEINLEALKSMNINTVLVGHSERRELSLETYNMTKEKIFKSLNAKFNTILCVGEKKKSENPVKFIKRVLSFYYKDLEENNLDYLTIAYEPIWAIGGEQSVNIKKIKKVNEIAKKYTMKKFGKEIKFIYGGSVNKENIEMILEQTDGVLIGSAGRDIKEIKQILKLIDK